MTPTISKELQEQIEREAEAFKKEPHYTNGSSLSSGPQIYLKRGYIAGATAYAHYKERFEQAKKALDRLKSVADTYSYTHSLNPPMKHLQAIINEALASWKEEGKETVTDVVEYPEADILANTAFIKWRDKHLCWHPYKKLYEAWRGNDCYTLQEAYRQFLSLTTEQTKTS